MRLITACWNFKSISIYSWTYQRHLNHDDKQHHEACFSNSQEATTKRKIKNVLQKTWATSDKHNHSLVNKKRKQVDLELYLVVSLLFVPPVQSGGLVPIKAVCSPHEPRLTGVSLHLQALSPSTLSGVRPSYQNTATNSQIWAVLTPNMWSVLCLLPLDRCK